MVDRSPEAIVTELHRAHYRSLVGLASLVVDRRDEAEEVVQDAFVRLYASWTALRDPERALAYLRACVLNGSRSRLRRRVVARRWLAAQPAPMASTVAAPGADEASAVAIDERDAIMAAIARLPRGQRDCVLLRYYADCSEREIADALGIRPGSVKSHLHRAMRALSLTLEGAR